MSLAASTAATHSPSLPIQSAAAHTAPAMALNSTTPDPIRLHMQALNSLSRCKAMLTANEPMYGFALQDLAAAQQAIAALQSIDLPLGSGKPCKPPKKNTLPPWQRRPSHAQNLPPAYHTHWAQCRPAQSADQPQSTPLGQ